MKSILRQFLSRKVTIILILLLSLVYFLGAIIPQKQVVGGEEYRLWQAQWPVLVSFLEQLGFTSIFSSPVVYLLTTLFFLHLVLVTWKRLPAIRAAVRLPERAFVTRDSLLGLATKEFIITSADSPERIKNAIQSRGYTLVAGDECLRGIKHSYSPIGSLLFHASFIVVLFGGMFIFHSRFSGGIHLTEGQDFSGSPQEYFTVRRLSGLRTSFPQSAFQLVSVRPEFEKNEATSLRTVIKPLRGTRKNKLVNFNVNFPYVDGNTTILVKDAGIAPYFEVRDAAGKEQFGAFINLKVLRGEEDHFAIPGSPYKIQVRFWPDFDVDNNGYIYTHSFDLKRPLFKITVFKQGREVADGKLHSPAETVDFDGLRLAYKEIRYFGTFNVTDEHGGEILITGFVIALIGLVVKFLFERREVLVLYRREGNDAFVAIACKNEYYRSAAARELEEIVSSAGLLETRP